MAVHTNTKNIIEVKNITKNYDNVRVVDNISFSVKKGEIFGILGPNGAGKTTTLETMESMRSIDSGKIFLDGINVATHPARIRECIGVQPQNPAFESKVRVSEIIELFAAAYGKKVDVKTFLKSVHLENYAHKYAQDLSGGQKQRLSIAASLVHDPRVFFLDEPTTGLDPQARRNIWDMISAMRDRGVTIVITTHYMDEAELLCDRIAIMDEGSIIALDTPKNLIGALLKKGFKKKQRVEQASLEDVFIDLTGKELRE